MFIKKLTQRYSLWVARGLSLLGIIGALPLVLLQWQTGVACPDIVTGLPACYVVAGGFGLLLVLSLIRSRSNFALGIALAGVLFAGFATTQNLLFGAVCPVTSLGIPQCYIAFTLFLGISLSFFLTKKSF